jgi:hypothetical protein
MAKDGDGAGIVIFLILVVAGYYGYQRLKQFWDSPSPTQKIDALKRIVADGVLYIACEGSISIYSPPRDIVASDGTKKSYELVFTDDFGQQQDLKDIASFEVAKAQDARFAMGPHATESNTSSTYADTGRLDHSSKHTTGMRQTRIGKKTMFPADRQTS